jgi:hypothetical protein
MMLWFFLGISLVWFLVLAVGGLGSLIHALLGLRRNI